MTDPKVIDWRRDIRYLPKFMRDFHDQKDLFKAIHATTKVEKHEYCAEISWVSGQCYVIDIFLWFMARHGYTLQRTPAKLPFDDLTKTVQEVREHQQQQAAKALMPLSRS